MRKLTLLLSLSLLFASSAFATVSLRLVPPSGIGEDLRGEWRVVVTNDGAAAEQVNLTARAPLDPVVAMPEGICAPCCST